MSREYVYDRMEEVIDSAINCGMDPDDLVECMRQAWHTVLSEKQNFARQSFQKIQSKGGAK